MFRTIAKREAKKSNHKQFLHSAIVVKGGSVVATGHNRGWCHAEVAALKKLWPSERKGCKIYSFRVTKTGKMAMAKPCKECQTFLRENGVKIVYYTNTKGDMEKMKL